MLDHELFAIIFFSVAVVAIFILSYRPIVISVKIPRHVTSETQMFSPKFNFVRSASSALTFTPPDAVIQVSQPSLTPSNSYETSSSYIPSMAPIYAPSISPITITDGPSIGPIINTNAPNINSARNTNAQITGSTQQQCPPDGITRSAEQISQTNSLSNAWFWLATGYIYAQLNGRTFCPSLWKGSKTSEFFFFGGLSYGPLTSSAEVLEDNPWSILLENGWVLQNNTFVLFKYAKQFQKFYWSTPRTKPDPHFAKGFNIVMEVFKRDEESIRSYDACLEFLKHDNGDANIYIYSKGEGSDLKYITDRHNVTLRLSLLGFTSKEAFHAMVVADLLIYADGDSYMASVFNKNRILHLEHCRPGGIVTRPDLSSGLELPKWWSGQSSFANQMRVINGLMPQQGKIKKTQEEFLLDIQKNRDSNDTCPPDGITRSQLLPLQGLGSRILWTITAYVYAKINQRQYCTSPWMVMGHGTDAMEMFEFIGGFSYGPVANPDTESLETLPWKLVTDDGMYNVNGTAAIFYYAPDYRKFYFSTPKPATKFAPGFSIAMHIRRGDGGDLRFRDNQFYIECIHILKSANLTDSRTVKKNIYIYSQGTEEDFKDIMSAHSDVTLRLEGNVSEVFHEFVSADFLVYAQSTFSMTASILNQNRILHINHCTEGGRLDGGDAIELAWWTGDATSERLEKMQQVSSLRKEGKSEEAMQLLEIAKAIPG